MAKCKKKQPRYNVVSVRVSDEERQLLEKLSAEENKKVSDLIREALQTITPPK
ncbi:DUF6290 family protein [Geomonas sp.]|uniref:DUF6290 family protein n=1 Tax=Geomonas sp. TaxID=2651584 RepID=UPI002B46FAB5|nr:DUF6290 family protein [Geomonas sp.]HJV33520.1 DUF6290 family protein [Geomonas sp.]